MSERCIWISIKASNSLEAYCGDDMENLSDYLFGICLILESISVFRIFLFLDSMQNLSQYCRLIDQTSSRHEAHKLETKQLDILKGTCSPMVYYPCQLFRSSESYVSLWYTQNKQAAYWSVGLLTRPLW